MKEKKLDDWFVPFEAEDSIKLNAVTEKDSSVKLSASGKLKISEDADIKGSD
jgi:hypothetical protein